MNRRSLTLAAGGLTLAASVAVGGPAFATDHKEDICHPKAGGWTHVNVAKKSSHFLDDGTPKHEHDGRVDTYSVGGLCPGEQPTPDPTTTTGSPTSQPTTTSPTTLPTEQPSTPSSSTSSTTSTTRPATTTTTSIPVATSSPQPPASTPRSSPSKNSRKPSAPRSTTTPAPDPAATPETLAFTGPFAERLAALGLGLLGAGLILQGVRRRA